MGGTIATVSHTAALRTGPLHEIARQSDPASIGTRSTGHLVASLAISARSAHAVPVWDRDSMRPPHTSQPSVGPVILSAIDAHNIQAGTTLGQDPAASAGPVMPSATYARETEAGTLFGQGPEASAGPVMPSAADPHGTEASASFSQDPAALPVNDVDPDSRRVLPLPAISVRKDIPPYVMQHT
ncbi:hypothetical protein HETIRDRAFT_422382 [Heterobasidion irregulare TC 32-1]|uniref:Uncharacterized protein n=1 Tax=Heterobasidion irregulare (strain TC 32-1) TaxID=747525 RepID=W4JS50_HETIT|nr:uncharacterized protein HETIRDRAFT_422382 [Heterobasidion irregulare TC 32-1]ETW75711.1 hypothetical protein HETIRDRAFT_422382 [Heterobasidion irregulare TC 32-1]